MRVQCSAVAGVERLCRTAGGKVLQRSREKQKG